jgi:hypothetical protein
VQPVLAHLQGMAGRAADRRSEAAVSDEALLLPARWKRTAEVPGDDRLLGACLTALVPSFSGSERYEQPVFVPQSRHV